MSDEKTGGVAFPIHTPPEGGCGPYTEYGMTLRDYFAAKAMQGFIIRDNCSYHEIMKGAYEFADGMLAERKQQEARR